MNKIKQEIDNAFRFYYRPLCLYAMHYLHDMNLVEDTVQDCFAKLWEKINCEHITNRERSISHEKLLTSKKSVSNIKSYLYMMVRNHCLDLLKKDNLVDYHTIPSDLTDTLSDEEVEERSLIEARLWTAIDSLPEKCRQVFLLSKRDGLKYKEIADLLNISKKTVENQISKALKTLKEGVTKIYYFFFG